jgi:hypothetical protein
MSATAKIGEDVGKHARIDVFKAPATKSAARPTGSLAGKALKSLEPRLAFGVDLAAVELRPLALVADHFISGVDFGKPLLGPHIALVAIGMAFLGQLAVGALDFRRAGRPVNAKHVIWVTHKGPSAF